MKVTFLKVAETELDDAFKYYESIQRDLGLRFIAEVKLSIPVTIQDAGIST